VTAKLGAQRLQVPGEVERQNRITADGVAWPLSETAPDSRVSKIETRDLSLPSIQRGLDDWWIGAA